MVNYATQATTVMKTETIPTHKEHPTAEEVSPSFRSELRYDMKNIYWELSKPHFGRFGRRGHCRSAAFRQQRPYCMAGKAVVDLFLIGKDMSMQYLLPLGIIVLFTLRAASPLPRTIS